MVESWLEGLQAAVEGTVGAGSTLVVAVSGGGDSVALLQGLVTLQEQLRLKLVVAHLDHALRPESGEDAAFVGQLALALRLPCLRERREVAALAETEGLNLEEAARRVRYQMLEEAARAVRADAIALAHTADDQSETILMHLLRGAGLDGLKGMTPLAPSPLPGATVPIFRPLLLIERAVLREWLRARGLTWREDATNLEMNRFRNRLRHRLIPLLEQEQPRLHRTLARTAQVLAADQAWLEAETEAAWQRIVSPLPSALRLEREPFLALHEALQRRLLRRAFFHLRPGARELSFEQVTQALEIAARGESGARATLPGHLFLIVDFDRLWVGEEVDLGGAPQLATPVVLREEGHFRLEGLTVTLRRVGREAIPRQWHELPPTIALLDHACLHWPLALRPPAPGDRWAPLGMGGQLVDLREWMAKHRLPVALRDRVPLLVDAEGRILWVVGWQTGELARVRPGTEQLLQIRVT